MLPILCHQQLKSAIDRSFNKSRKMSATPLLQAALFLTALFRFALANNRYFQLEIGGTTLRVVKHKCLSGLPGFANSPA